MNKTLLHASLVAVALSAGCQALYDFEPFSQRQAEPSQTEPSRAKLGDSTKADDGPDATGTAGTADSASEESGHSSEDAQAALPPDATVNGAPSETQRGEQDTSPCEAAHTCEPGTCIEEGDSFRCECPPPFVRNGNQRCDCGTDYVLSTDGQDCRALVWGEVDVLDVAVPSGLPLETMVAFDVAQDDTAVMVWAEKEAGPAGASGDTCVLRFGTRIHSWESGWTSLGYQTVPGGSWLCTPAPVGLSVSALESHTGVVVALGYDGEAQLLSAELSPEGLTNLGMHPVGGNVQVDFTAWAGLTGNGKDTALLTWVAADFRNSLFSFVDVYRRGEGWRGSQLLQGGGSHTAGVDLNGNELLVKAGVFQVGQAGVWGAEVTNEGVAPPLVVNPHGYAVAGAPPSRRFSFAEQAWSVLAPTDAGENAVSGIDQHGTILTVWAENESIYWQRSDGLSWGPATRLTTGYEPKKLRLDVADSGDAILAWSESEAGLGAARFNSALGGWGNLKRISLDFLDEVGFVDVRTRGPSGGLVVWTVDRGEEEERRQIYSMGLR